MCRSQWLLVHGFPATSPTPLPSPTCVRYGDIVPHRPAPHSPQSRVDIEKYPHWKPFGVEIPSLVTVLAAERDPPRTHSKPSGPFMMSMALITPLSPHVNRTNPSGRAEGGFVYILSMWSLLRSLSSDCHPVVVSLALLQSSIPTLLLCTSAFQPVSLTASPPITIPSPIYSKHINRYTYMRMSTPPAAPPPLPRPSRRDPLDPPILPLLARCPPQDPS